MPDHRNHSRPASTAQTGIWTTQQGEPDNPFYNCAVVIDLNGTLDHDALRRSVFQAVAETETLRTRFHATADGVEITVEPAGEPVLSVVDLSHHAKPQAAAEQRIADDLRTATDLMTEAPYTHMLFVLGPGRSLLYFRYHHIVMDGFGQYLYFQRLAELYTAFESGRAPAPSVAAPLGRLLDEDAAYAGSTGYAEDAAFWRAEFADPPESTPLAGRIAPVNRSVSRSALLAREHFGPQLGTGSGSVGRWSATIVAATGAYLHRLLGHSEVIINLPMAARRSRAALTTPAMLANELPVRLSIDASTSFAQLVTQSETKIRHTIRHQRYRNEFLRADLGQTGVPTALGPQVNVMTFGRDVRFGSCGSEPRQLPTSLIADLTINVFPAPAGRGQAAGIRLEFNGNSTLYTEDDVADHQERFLTLLESAAAEPDRPLAELSLSRTG